MPISSVNRPDTLRQRLSEHGLYRPLDGHAHCGVGAIVSLDGSASHANVDDALTLLANLDHRGARGAEDNTGDGAGILLQVADAFFRREVPELEGVERFAVGQLFLSPDKSIRQDIVKRIEDLVADEQLRILAWREVPTRNDGLGNTALESEPVVVQLLVACEEKQDSDREFDDRIYLLRRLLEKEAEARRIAGEEFNVCSLHRRLIVYKGLLTCAQLRSYYPDLGDPDMKTGLAMVHARFSTNTLGAWWLAQPFQHCVHNGEFNTARGNRNWLKAREAVLAHPRYGENIEKLKPLLNDNAGDSDSASFDRLFGLLLNAGRSLPHVLRMMIPAAWRKDPDIEPSRAAFYDFHSTLMEPWDGPALVVGTDGENVSAVLDRNGLRPCRWTETTDGRLVIASETGALGLPPEKVAHRDRIAPGGMLMADTGSGEILDDDDIFSRLCDPHYAAWLAGNRLQMDDLIHHTRREKTADPDDDWLEERQRAFGYTEEGLRYLMLPMAEEGIDPVGAMGSDTPPTALSAQSKSLFGYFSQAFAQVSNPPIDHIRESLVTSLYVHLGHQRNLLDESESHCRQLLLKSPVLNRHGFRIVSELKAEGLSSQVIDITLPADQALDEGLQELRNAAARTIEAGADILILSDRNTSRSRKAIPSLLATSAVHHHLIRQGLRNRVGLVVDTGELQVVHHLCALLGYGADAVHPWLALETVAHPFMQQKSGADENEARMARANFCAALESGLLKVMAKMGITSVEAYKGAQIFETLGLDQGFVDEFFTGTPASIGGVGLQTFADELDERHKAAFMPRPDGSAALPEGGDYYWRRDGELHQWNPLTIANLQQAVRNDDAEAYRAYADFINKQSGRLQTLSGLLDFDTAKRQSIPIDEVEPVEDIMRRFSTGSMSFGSLSQEAHEALAVAMNRIGGKSGTGEGGEQVERFGTERECSMKQVASGRFGVTLEYLNRAQQIEIKMAQGAKPGEGGELPGGKVDEGIAKVRFTVPGVGLISPPPHHDIYSIEDLAQLIHDLKCVAPQAEIHVKLVAKAGVGTIAAGVAKAKADAILISGDSGGTGAAKKTSIKHAGSPWELGLAETQQVLVASRLRSRITLRADGGFKTGRDVAIAALLGAEEYGFGTAPLVTLGCIMLRKCHCNTCSVGVATQDKELRARFAGKPEHIISYMRFVAEEVREIMAMLGIRRLEDMIGHPEYLRAAELEHPKGIRLDLSKLLAAPAETEAGRIRQQGQDHKLEKQLDNRFWDETERAVRSGESVVIRSAISNIDRAAGTLLSARLQQAVLADDPSRVRDGQVRLDLEGPAGQSLGAFLAHGITLDLEGEANDYVAKGLSGGRIIVHPYHRAQYPAAENILVGNTCLYGATSGELYINGLAGERFAVRNSGAIAVVEGVGDHGCEYMTGGTVLVLGSVGRNFAAGMSGGVAYVHMPQDKLDRYLNKERVHMESCDTERDRRMLHRLLKNHHYYTGSQHARAMLDNWPRCIKQFIKIIPEAYARAVDRFAAQGEDILTPLPPKASEVHPQRGPAIESVPADKEPAE
ncbi:MAG: glutamate synthase large subunit [Gammaproteobacteria bacterium]|nr:glutamate synthase large subunit [Gammaproteobacteria bacterium]